MEDIILMRRKVFVFSKESKVGVVATDIPLTSSINLKYLINPLFIHLFILIGVLTHIYVK